MLLIDAEISVVGNEIIDMLKGMADDAENKRSRACLSQTNSAVQEMVIVLKEGSYIRPHMHPKLKAESYHLVEGELLVKIFTPTGEVYKEIKLNKKNPVIRIKGGWYHQPVSLTPYVTYHEVYEGPFIKEQDVSYAPWANEEV